MNQLAIQELNKAIKVLEDRIEASYERSNEMQRQQLPEGASWDVTDKQLSAQRDKFEKDINDLKWSIMQLSVAGELK